jgi:hypothetical protein
VVEECKEMIGAIGCIITGQCIEFQTFIMVFSQLSQEQTWPLLKAAYDKSDIPKDEFCYWGNIRVQRQGVFRVRDTDQS